jgi:hypothetical protein
MVTITPLTVAEILERAGLMPDAIAEFTTANPTKTASLSKFQNALRARKYSVHDGLLVGLDDSPVWDCYDSITLEDLSLWFISVDPKTGEPFDWNTQFTTTVFTLFGFTSGDTSPPGDERVPPRLFLPLQATRSLLQTFLRQALLILPPAPLLLLLPILQLVLSQLHSILPTSTRTMIPSFSLIIKPLPVELEPLPPVF